MTPTEEAIAQRAEELIPTTIDGILSFADSYNAPEQVEAVFRWDVSDIFYNYFFVGNYADVGGPYGDDEKLPFEQKRRLKQQALQLQE